MITEQYVTFETARMLKEAGFDSPTRGIYRTNRTGDHSFVEYNMKQTVDDLSWNAGDGFQYEYLAPTQSLAARWIREVHNLHVLCELTKYMDWFYCIDRIEPYEHVSNTDFDCFEDALEAGLQEALQQIIKKSKRQ